MLLTESQIPASFQMAKTWKGDAENMEMMKKDYLGKDGDSIQIVCTENNSV